MFSSKFRRSGNVSLFDRQDTEEKPGKIGNPPERLSQVIDFEIFRLILEEELLNHNKKNNAGAKPTDVVPMFKIMILQRYCNISDGHTEYQIPDRLSFRKFLGLASGDKIPDARSIRLFKGKLTKNHVTEQLYEVFNNDLYNKCLIINEGQTADAGFVEVPRRRNTKSENEQIKEGKGDELRNSRPDKKRRKDIDARRTKKNNETFYGYRRDNKIEGKSKFAKKGIETTR